MPLLSSTKRKNTVFSSSSHSDDDFETFKMPSRQFGRPSRQDSMQDFFKARPSQDVFDLSDDAYDSTEESFTEERYSLHLEDDIHSSISARSICSSQPSLQEYGSVFGSEISWNVSSVSSFRSVDSDVSFPFPEFDKSLNFDSDPCAEQRTSTGMDVY